MRGTRRAPGQSVKEAIVVEAETIAAEATHWKNSSERLRRAGQRRAAPTGGGDRCGKTAVRGPQYQQAPQGVFAELTEERDEARARKEKLCVEAEALADSTDWAATAAAFRDLMRSWKAAGRAARADEDEMWGRFKTAQDTFFHARSEVYSAKDVALREHADVKTQLLEEAGKLVPVTDVRAARSALRGIQERWEQAGGPRRGTRTAGVGPAPDRTRCARRTPSGGAPTPGPAPAARSSRSAAPSRAGGPARHGGGGEPTRAVQEAQDALDARRAWLEEAERALDELTG